MNKFQIEIGSAGTGTLDIQSESEISIAANGAINASTMGLNGKEECAVYDEYVQLKNEALKKENNGLELGTLRLELVMSQVLRPQESIGIQAKAIKGKGLLRALKEGMQKYKLMNNSDQKKLTSLYLYFI